MSKEIGSLTIALRTVINQSALFDEFLSALQQTGSTGLPYLIHDGKAWYLHIRGTYVGPIATTEQAVQEYSHALVEYGKDHAND
jgi:hypothetical protein